MGLGGREERGKVPTLLLPKSNNWPTLVITSDYHI
jgi:hypothetical protein